MILQEISLKLQAGRSKVVKELVQQALNEGISAQAILEEALLPGMDVMSEKFKNNEVFVPEVLVAARAMNFGMEILKPHLVSEGVKAAGKVCIGTVQGDLHDIGKNLVKMMLEGKGFEVIDLGTDVSPQRFVQTAIDEALESLERQIRKNKTKLEKRLRSQGAAVAAGITEMADELSEATDFVVRRKEFDLKPMSVEEAILQMNMLGHSFFMFKESRYTT